jgi:hypothetical protein
MAEIRKGGGGASPRRTARGKRVEGVPRPLPSAAQPHTHQQRYDSMQRALPRVQRLGEECRWLAEQLPVRTTLGVVCTLTTLAGGVCGARDAVIGARASLVPVLRTGHWAVDFPVQIAGVTVCAGAGFVAGAALCCAYMAALPLTAPATAAMYAWRARASRDLHVPMQE